jgi:hypothetical protein
MERSKYIPVGTDFNDTRGEGSVEGLEGERLRLVRSHRIVGHANNGGEGEGVVLCDADKLALENAVPKFLAVVGNGGESARRNDAVGDTSLPGASGLRNSGKRRSRRSGS